MVFGPAELIAFVTGVMTLLPGDVILTGTPEGIGPLQDGDLRLIELAGFLSDDDPRLTALTQAEAAIARLWLAGSYAQPLKVGPSRPQQQGAD